MSEIRGKNMMCKISEEEKERNYRRSKTQLTEAISRERFIAIQERHHAGFVSWNSNGNITSRSVHGTGVEIE